MKLGLTTAQMSRLEELLDRREELPNVDSYDRLAHSVTLQFAVEQNLDELKKCESKVLSVKDAARAQAQLLDFGRLLLNYLAASMGLVDHSFSYMNHYAEDELKQSLDADIQAAADDPLSWFVKDLRHVFLHCFAPSLVIVHERGADRVALRRRELLDKYGKWSSGAREYMDTGGGEYIEVLSTLRCHRDLVSVFRRRLWHAVRRVHEEDFNAIEAIDDEIREIYLAGSDELPNP